MDPVLLARQVFDIEIEALRGVSQRLDSSFRKAVEIIKNSQGRLVVVGMGKSGIIGRKIAATLASTGTPSFFVHPGEAFHGDLGMIRPMDMALMISNSGETEELIRILPFMAHQKNPVIALTGNINSTLAKHANVVLDISVDREACNNNLAPTSSTTATLAMGDALAVVLSTIKGFQPEDFARFHPGGSLGRKLLTLVGDVMHKGVLPICSPKSSFKDIVRTITIGRLGLAIVMAQEKLVGVITDGDIRRALENEENPMAVLAENIMTSEPLTIGVGDRFAVAEELMRDSKVNSLLVLNDAGGVVGVLQIYDLSM